MVTPCGLPVDKVDKIANDGRKSISSYCINDCKSYCCRKGYLVMSKKQLDVVINNKKEEYKEQVKELKNGKVSLFLGSSGKPCPSLRKDFKCGIHSNPERPKACRDFPIFLKKESKTVLLSPRCLAVRTNMLYPHIKRFELLGYKIVKVDEIVNLVGVEIPGKVIDERVAEKRLNR